MDKRVINQAIGKNYAIYQADCVDAIRNIPTESIHYSIFSPPFAQLYVYSNSERDMGNSRSGDEFIKHFGFLVSELYRVLVPGRLITIHCMDLPAMKERDGYIGLKDFPGEIIKIFEKAGFIYHSRTTIWKDPLIEATRTKALGLMHKQLVKDSAMCRNGLPDYLITVRKPGENPEPIAHPDGLTSYIGTEEPDAPKKKPELKDSRRPEHKKISLSKKDPVYSHHVWRKYASPVWMDIDQTNTLQRASAREEKDERHICPLQLDVIERALTLWSNEGDIVLSPFAGIGSEGYVAIQKGRRFVGFELKQSYYEQAEKNLTAAEKPEAQTTIFEAIESETRCNNG